MNDQPNPAPSGPVQQWRPLLKGERAEKGDKIAILLGGMREPYEWDWPHVEGTHQSYWRTTRPIHEAAIAVAPIDPAPPQPAPDRHEASRAAFEAAHPYLSHAWNETKNRYRDSTTLGLYEVWCAALDWVEQEDEKRHQRIKAGLAEAIAAHPELDHAAQEQPAPEPNAGSETESDWKGAAEASDAIAAHNLELWRVSQAKLAAAERRVERLRGALEDIANNSNPIRDPLSVIGGDVSAADNQFNKLQQIARAALAETKEDASNE